MSSSFTVVTTIDRCRACLHVGRVEAGSRICHGCLARYGRRMVALAIRAREDLVFRAEVRRELAERSPHRLRLFDLVFGPIVRAVP